MYGRASVSAPLRSARRRSAYADSSGARQGRAARILIPQQTLTGKKSFAGSNWECAASSAMRILQQGRTRRPVRTLIPHRCSPGSGLLQALTGDAWSGSQILVVEVVFMCYYLAGLQKSGLPHIVVRSCQPHRHCNGEPPLTDWRASCARGGFVRQPRRTRQCLNSERNYFIVSGADLDRSACVSRAFSIKVRRPQDGSGRTQGNTRHYHL